MGRRRGPYPASPVAPGVHAYPEVVRAMARARFLEVLDELSGGKLRGGLLTLVPLAREVEDSGVTLRWDELEGSHPKAQALAEQIRGLFSSLGLPPNLPDPWPYRIATDTLAFELKYPTHSGEKIEFVLNASYWESFEPAPIHPLLPAVVYDPTWTARVTITAQGEPEVRVAGRGEVRERMVAQVMSAAKELRPLVGQVRRVLQNEAVAKELRDLLAKVEDLLHRERVEDLLNLSRSKTAVQEWIETYMGFHEERVAHLVDRTPGVDEVAYRALAARLLRVPIKPHYRGMDPAQVSRGVSTLIKLLPLELKRKRGCPPSKRPSGG